MTFLCTITIACLGGAEGRSSSLRAGRVEDRMTSVTTLAEPLLSRSNRVLGSHESLSGSLSRSPERSLGSSPALGYAMA